MNLSIDYFLNQIPSVASDYCKAYFDFESGILPDILINKSGDLSLNGQIYNLNPDFWSVNGSGYFKNNTYLEFTGINNIINTKDFTLSLVYENKGLKGSTLISTVETGVFTSFNMFGEEQSNLIYKGFNFGITANNKLFFEYYSNEGPNIFVSDFALSDKNSIFLTITENNLAFGHYDFFRNILNTNNYYISTDYLFDYNTMCVGYNPNTNNLYNFNKNFTGYIDELLIFSPSIYAYDIVNLNSGFVHNYNSGFYFEYINTITGITGYDINITGYITGITGTVLIETGTAYDLFGIEYSLYFESGLTGLIEQVDTIPLTGTIESELISGFSGQGIFLNKRSLMSFGKEHINLLSNISSGDILDINLVTALKKPYYIKNLNLDYQRYANSFSIPETINFISPIVYVNGQLQHSGSFYQTGNAYNLSQYIINDYYLNEFNNFLFANDYNENDSVFIDLTSGYDQNLYIENFSITGGDEILELTGWNGLTNNIYFNGQKLINGIHYKTLHSSPYQTLTGSSISNDLYGAYFETNFDGSILFVSASIHNSNAGIVYVYKDTGDGYKQKQILNGKNLANHNFGNTNISCDYSGKLVVIGSRTPTNNGEVFIYKTNDYNSWSLMQILSGDYPNNYIGDGFGFSNAISLSNDGKTLIVGSRFDTPGTLGAIWVYTGDSNNSWILTQKITGFDNTIASEGSFDSSFPTNIVTNGNGTVIFASAEIDREDTDQWAGTVSIYTGLYGKFSFFQKVKGDPSGLSFGDLFGRSLDCDDSGNTFIVGSLHDNFGVSFDGSLFIFKRDDKNSYYELVQKNLGDLTKSERKNDRLGFYTSIDGNGNIIQCSSQHDGPTSNYGALWLFQQNDNSYPLIDKKTGEYAGLNLGSNNKISFDGKTSIVGFAYAWTTLTPRSVRIYKNKFESGFIQFDRSNILYSGVQGKLLGIPKSTDFYNYIAETNLYSSNIRYFNGFSEIYKNGLRQTLGSDYLELAKFDINTGLGFFDQKQDLIYNNEDLFNL